MTVCGQKVEKMWRREKVWYGVPRCPTVFLGVPVFLRCSSVLLVDLRCIWEFLGVPGCPTLLVSIPRGSSLSYGVPCGFFVFLRCSSGFLAVLRCSSGFLVVLLWFSVFLVVLRSSSGFLDVLALLRVAKLFCGVTRRSGFLPRQLL